MPAWCHVLKTLDAGKEYMAEEDYLVQTTYFIVKYKMWNTFFPVTKPSSQPPALLALLQHTTLPKTELNLSPWKRR